ncbi:hypothetical protein T492DRAFT_1143699 [Pavlovales sp. CCMP2436]|nr:hypothetical protein T492DRAFT_1143699 [Pavlovales sp. CCMP2436]
MQGRRLPARLQNLLCLSLGFVLSPVLWLPWLGGRSAMERHWPDGGNAATHATHASAHLHGGVRVPANRSVLPAPGTSSASGALPEHHPEFRLALIVPWLGTFFPPWFAYFLASAGRSAIVADWLIFHEGANWAEEVIIIIIITTRRSLWELPANVNTRIMLSTLLRTVCPPNVLFHDLGPSGLAYHFGTSLARILNMSADTQRLVRYFEYSFKQYTYIVTEYKPTLGAVFAPYLQGYSHWSYTDLDVVAGDIPLFLERDELTNFDIVSWSFGDHERLYLRGQFSMHANSTFVNSLFAKSEHLGAGLLKELAFKATVHKQMSATALKEGKPPPRVRFISAEGCYSSAVYSTPGIRVKITNKILTDFGLEGDLEVVGGSVRQCPILPALLHTAGLTPRARRGACALGSEADEGDDANAIADRGHSLLLSGTYVPAGPLLPVAIHADCSRWVDAR